MWERLALLGFFIAVVFFTIWCCTSVCGTQYDVCPNCGERVAVSSDGWLAYECKHCGTRGKFQRPC